MATPLLNAAAYTYQPNSALVQLVVRHMMKSHAITLNRQTNSSVICGDRYACCDFFHWASCSSPFHPVASFSYAGFSSGGTCGSSSFASVRSDVNTSLRVSHQN